MDTQAVVLCAGIAVQDLIFRVERFPPPGGKSQASEFVTIGGGCAANAAIAVARLGGAARYTGPLGDPGDPASVGILAALARERVETAGVVHVPGAAAPLSAILVDGAGERMIVTRRDPRLDGARARDPEALLRGVKVLLADNRLPDFVLPVCVAARRHGIPTVLDADRAVERGDPLLAQATHAIFSSEALRATAGMADPAPALQAMAARAPGFLAVTDGPGDVLWLEAGAVRRLPVPRVKAVDTLAAGDVFHGAFALALAEGRAPPEALRFAAAAASLKCTRFGGVAGAPERAEVEAVDGRAVPDGYRGAARRSTHSTADHRKP